MADKTAQSALHHQQTGASFCTFRVAPFVRKLNTNLPSMLKKVLLLFFCALIQHSSLFGQFGPQQVIESNINAVTDITSADINNDGWQDLLISQKFGEPNDNILLYLNLGDNSFQKQQILFQELFQPPAIAAGDLNGDGFEDVLTSSSSNPSHLLWLPNNGGTFSTPIGIDSSLFVVIDFKIEDIDNDNDMDIILISDTALITYYNDGNANFQKSLVPAGLNTEYYDLFLSDLDGDSFKEAIIGGVKTLIYKNENGTLSYDADRSNSIENQGLVTLVAAGDCDEDGDTDILINGNSSSDLRWYANDGNGFFSLKQVIIENVVQQKSISLNDFDQDGDLDIAAAYAQTAQTGWFENLGGGLFGAFQAVGEGSSPHTRQVHTTDLNNDNAIDFIWADPLSFHLNTFTVGLKNPQGPNFFSVHPNPAPQGHFSLHAKEKAELTIYTANGQLLYDKLSVEEGENTFSLQLKPGLYFLHIQSKNTTTTRKLLIP